MHPHSNLTSHRWWAMLVTTVLCLPNTMFAQRNGSLDEVLLNVGSATEAEVRIIASQQANSSAGPHYHSVFVEKRSFFGLFTPASAMTQLAIFSDDGCDIYVDGTKIHSRLNQGQALPDLGQSFHLVTPQQPWEAGREYDVRVEYSNTIYQGLTDIDGATLFAFNGGGRMSGNSGNGSGGGDGMKQPGPVDLVISNGQGGTPLSEDDEETPGAFTVANLNDSDTSKSGDNIQNSVPGEKDLMKLELKRPTGSADADSVTLTVAGSVKLWMESTKVTEETNRDFTASTLPPVLWVEATAGSRILRDIQLTMSCNGQSDMVKATAIWATMTGFRNTNPATTLTGDAANSDPLSRQIVVTRPIFAVGDHIIIFSETPDPSGSSPRAGYTVVAVSGTTLTLDQTLGRAWAAGDKVRHGMSAEVGNPEMIRTFLRAGGLLGAYHVSPWAVNGMEMRFTVQPQGIGLEPGIKFDITRQKESIGWTEEAAPTGYRWDDLVFGDVVPSTFPAGDEIPNDDGWNNNQQDEDNTPNNNYIFSRDTPGVASDTANYEQLIMRFNMEEFVRLKLDGSAFANQNGQIEGSRCSNKVPWYSRMALIRDYESAVTSGELTTYKWKRNGIPENEIELGSKALTPR